MAIGIKQITVGNMENSTHANISPADIQGREVCDIASAPPRMMTSETHTPNLGGDPTGNKRPGRPADMRMAKSRLRPTPPYEALPPCRATAREWAPLRIPGQVEYAMPDGGMEFTP